tara:strand:- start:17 stop:190 length:174 start_codon:yes stop_codon:yes gene_type:complete
MEAFYYLDLSFNSKIMRANNNAKKETLDSILVFSKTELSYSKTIWAGPSGIRTDLNT